MLTRIDSFLLDKAQKFCDKFQRLTGFTKFRIEKWLLIMIPLFAFVGLLITALTAETGVHIIILAFIVVLAMIPVVGLYSLAILVVERQEREFLKSGKLSAHAETNVPIFRIAGMAVFFLSVYTIDFLGLAIVLALMCCTAVSYVLMCVPRPPSKSKMREWLENGLTWMNGILPEPTPIRVPAISD